MLPPTPQGSVPQMSTHSSGRFSAFFSSSFKISASLCILVSSFLQVTESELLMSPTIVDNYYSNNSFSCGPMGLSLCLALYIASNKLIFIYFTELLFSNELNFR